MTSMVHEGIRGNAGLYATFDGNAVDGDVKAMRLTTEDRDDADLTFLEAASGETKDYSLVVTAIQSTAAGSFWRMVWDDPSGEYAVVYGPHGNVTPTADRPHFTFTVRAAGRPEIGTEASLSRTRADFEYTFDVTSPIALSTGTV